MIYKKEHRLVKEIIVYEFERTIEVSIDIVFNCLNKDEHVLKWNTMILEHIYEGSEEDMKVGAKYITKQQVDKKIFTIEAEIVEYDPPFKVAVASKTKEGYSTTYYQLTELDSGETHLAVKVSLIPSNFFYKLAVKLTKGLSKFVYDEQFENFIAYLYHQQSDYWKITYYSEQLQMDISVEGYLNSENKWDVYFNEVLDESVYNKLIIMNYKFDEERGLYLYQADDYEDAYVKLMRWTEETFLNIART